jgi:cyclophilin family peptidyl-prolyl cis-trans isomerase
MMLSAVLAALLATFSCTWGQEPAAAPDGEQFAAAKTEWERLEKDVTAIVVRFRAADAADQPALRKEYEALIAKSQGVLKNLRGAAIAAYKAAPGQDPEVEATLVRFLTDDARRDDFEAALPLADLLIKNDTKHYEVYNYAGIAAYGVDNFAQAETWLKLAEENNTLSQQGAIYLQDAAGAQERFEKEKRVRAEEQAADDLPRVKLTTSQGEVIVELFENEAPETVGNFVSLVESGFYDGLTFHRVLPGFMAQGGDPKGTGSGGPGYKIYCETDKPEHRNHFRGTLSMAHAGKDTGGSQFFLTFRATPHLDGLHTAFGRVVEGFEVLAKLRRRDPQANNPPDADRIVKAEVLRKRDHKYEPRKVE